MLFLNNAVTVPCHHIIQTIYKIFNNTLAARSTPTGTYPADSCMLYKAGSPSFSF